jgi:hypothetical protein
MKYRKAGKERFVSSPSQLIMHSYPILDSIYSELLTALLNKLQINKNRPAAGVCVQQADIPQNMAPCEILIKYQEHI